MKRTLILLCSMLVLALAALATLGLTSSLATNIPAHAKGNYVLVDGLRIRVWQQGHGQDLLLIHGLPGSLEDWDPVIEDLASRYRVTVYDRPGHGYSELRRSSANLQGNVDIALGLIEALGLQNVIVAGHSYGGMMAASMASERPASVAAYVSVSGLVHREAAQEESKLIYQIINIPLIGTGIARLANPLIGGTMMKEGLARAFDPDKAPDNYSSTRAPLWLSVKSALAVSGEQVAMPRDLRYLGQQLKNRPVVHPLVIVHGRQDLAVPISNAEHLHREVPHSTLVPTNAVGHMVQFTAPEAVIQAIASAHKQMALAGGH